jgi:hypothetical protein
MGNEEAGEAANNHLEEMHDRPQDAILTPEVKSEQVKKEFLQLTGRVHELLRQDPKAKRINRADYTIHHRDIIGRRYKLPKGVKAEGVRYLAGVGGKFDGKVEMSYASVVRLNPEDEDLVDPTISTDPMVIALDAYYPGAGMMAQMEPSKETITQKVFLNPYGSFTINTCSQDRYGKTERVTSDEDLRKNPDDPATLNAVADIRSLLQYYIHQSRN